MKGKRSYIFGIIILVSFAMLYSSMWITSDVHGNLIDGRALKLHLSLKYPRASIFLSDCIYQSVDLNHLKSFLNSNNIPSMTYISEFRDCDDYAIMMLGNWKETYPYENLFGYIVFEKGEYLHATNLCIDNNGNEWIVEPQCGTYYKVPENLSVVFIFI